MKVFNEEIYKGKGTSILLIDSKEGKMLIDIVKAACNSNPRKKTWKKFQEDIDIKLSCF